MKNRIVQVVVILASIGILSGYAYDNKSDKIVPVRVENVSPQVDLRVDVLENVATTALVGTKGKGLEVSLNSTEVPTESITEVTTEILTENKDIKPKEKETQQVSDSGTETYDITVEESTNESEQENSEIEEISEDTEEVVGEVETKGYGICETEGDIDYSYVQSVEDRLSCLPSYMVEAFVNSGWHYYLTNSDLATKKGKQAGTILGNTSYKDKRIYVEADNYAISDSVLHEFGHYWDCRCGFPSESTEFEGICSEEWDTYISELAPNSAYSSNREIFADSFEYYFTDSNRLASVCPRIYEFISRYIN